MAENLLEEAILAIRTGNQQKAEQLIHQIASASDDVLDILVKELQPPGKLPQALAIRIIRVIGYPKNQSAIPELLYHIGDPNLPGWLEAVHTLTDMGPDVIVPHLVKALLEKGEPYHTLAGKNQTWAYDVEGICSMLSLSSLEREYALRCCPAINTLLSSAKPASSPEIDSLLDVVEKAGNQVHYVLPTLIAIAQKFPTSDDGKHAKHLISTFEPETLVIYRLLIDQL